MIQFDSQLILAQVATAGNGAQRKGARQGLPAAPR